MADFFMGQIMMTGFGYPPKYFAGCNGSLLQISQNQALFSLLGIVYGGDGVTTFALPDLRGRTPVGGGFGSVNPNWTATAYALGAIAGVETVGLSSAQNAQHTHLVTATSASGATPSPDGSQVFAATNSASLYGSAQTLLPLAGGPTSTAGAGQSHENMQPFEVINFNIALNGIYPSRG